MKYTAEEVRAIAKRLHDDITVADGDVLMASDMLTAYAERIEADDRVVPVAEVGRDWTLHWVGHGPIAPIITENNIRIGDKLFTRPPAQPAERVPEVVGEVMAELGRAMAKFPTWPTDPLHAIGVVNEEVGELAKAVLQQVYEPHKNKPDDVRKEAVQAAAMAIRFLASMAAYRFTPGEQHDQPALAAAAC